MEYKKKNKQLYIPPYLRSRENKSSENITSDKSSTFIPYRPQHSYFSNNLSKDTNKIYGYRNIYALKKKIFPPIAEEKICHLMIDEESLKYITYATSAQEITNIIMNNLSDFPCPKLVEKEKWEEKTLNKKMKKLVITEMTAGVGGNVLNFANHFKYVNAIEIDSVRYNFLNKNVQLYNYNNVNCYNCNSLDLLIEKDDIVQDIIFFDPPWGGKNYKMFTALRLIFEQYSIEEICKILFKRSQNKMIVMKLPNNYDFDYLNKELEDFKITQISLERMTIIILKNYDNDNKI
jgi:16S rRNA G966 N2-methylase RsmD